MDSDLIRKIQKHIMELAEFKEDFELDEFYGVMDDTDMEDTFYNTYHGLHIGTEVLILNEYSCNHGDERTFYLYKISDDVLRMATKEEDEIFRELDDNYPLREWPDLAYIISKGYDNTIEYPWESWELFWIEEGDLVEGSDRLQQIVDCFDKETLEQLAFKQRLIESSQAAIEETCSDIMELFRLETMDEKLEFRVDEDGDIYVNTGKEIPDD